MSSCSNDDDEKKEYETITGDATAVQEACKAWKSARKYWEWSEAFLYGAASDYDIDPHIDTWPVDQTALAQLLRDATVMNDIDNHIGNQDDGILGFHGLEYVIFRNGAARDASQITELEYKYGVAVAKDIYECACVLQACWAGRENIPAERQTLVNAFFAAHNSGYTNYGASFTNYGDLYETPTDATIQILEGTRDIISEVQSGKIGTPYTGEDPNYIESPYAYNSIQDFYDNIEGCKFALYGKLGATEPQENSVIKTCQGIEQFKSETNAVVSALNNALEKIRGMKAPFVLYYTDSTVKTAMDALEQLDETIGILEEKIQLYKSNNDLNETFKKVNSNYISNVVVPTYKGLADEAAVMAGKVNSISE